MAVEIVHKHAFMNVVMTALQCTLLVVVKESVTVNLRTCWLQPTLIHTLLQRDKTQQPQGKYYSHFTTKILVTVFPSCKYIHFTKFCYSAGLKKKTHRDYSVLEKKIAKTTRLCNGCLGCLSSTSVATLILSPS